MDSSEWRKAGRTAAKRVVGSRDTERFVWARWALTRAQALGGVRGLIRAEAVEWDSVSHARLVPVEMAGPRRGQVLVKTLVSAVSPGTERAFFRGDANASTTFPVYPGYSIAATVLDAPGTAFEPGHLVAAEAAHASAAVVDADHVFAVPDGVTPESASFLLLGIIATHALWRGALERGERVAVFGRGPLGQVAVQLARAHGADVVSIAPSARRLTGSLSRFAGQILVDPSADVLDGLGVDVAVEFSGAPAAVAQAVAATRHGGRVVLAGSTRGVARNVSLARLADSRIELIGAHQSTLSRVPGADHGYREAGETFLRLLQEGALDVESLVSEEVAPDDVSRFYRALAEDNSGQASIGALIRWEGLPADRRATLVWPWTPPAADARPPRIAAVPRSAAPVAARSSRTVGVALIGCGGRGLDVAGFVVAATTTSLAMVMDADPARAANAGEKLGVPWTTSLDAVLSNDRVEAVFVATPHHLHAGSAVEAAKAGRHVMVEKPLAHDLVDARLIVEAAREAGVRLSTWLGVRYDPRVAAARHVAGSGVLGDLLGASLTYHYLERPYSLSRGETPGTSSWRTRWTTAGGGVLMNRAVHYLDVLRHVPGVEIVEVSARYTCPSGPVEVENAIVMWLRYDNGALATLNVSSSVPGHYGARRLGIDCRFWGTDGQISLYPPRYISALPIDGHRAERWHALTPPPLRPMEIEYLERFGSAVIAGTEVDITGEDGLWTQAIMDAAYTSAGDGGRPMMVERP